MKKIVVIAFCLVLISELGYSQIEVGSNNKVGIGISGAVNSKLSVNNIGSISALAWFYGTNTGQEYKGIYSRMPVPTNDYHWHFGIQTGCAIGKGYSVGLFSSAVSSNIYTSGRTFGVYSRAGNATNGYNYGVFGLLFGNNNGAAIYGTLGSWGNTGVYIDGRYAGYFNGNAKVTGTLYYNALSQTSDINAKKDIRDLEKNNIAKLKQVRAVKYKYKTPQESGLYKSNSSDTAAYEMNAEMLAFYEKERIGLLAQELQKVYPDIVVESPDGTLGVDYIALIPVLLEAIKEQQTAIENLTEEVNKIKRKSDKQ